MPTRVRSDNAGRWVRWLVSAFLVILFSGATAGVTAWKMAASYVDIRVEFHNKDETAHQAFRSRTTATAETLDKKLSDYSKEISELKVEMAELKTEIRLLRQTLQSGG